MKWFIVALIFLNTQDDPKFKTYRMHFNSFDECRSSLYNTSNSMNTAIRKRHPTAKRVNIDCYDWESALRLQRKYADKLITLHISMDTMLENHVVQQDTIATYELHTTLKICNMYIKPAFEQAKATPPYNIRIKAECYNEKAQVPLLQDPSRPWHKNR